MRGLVAPNSFADHGDMLRLDDLSDYLVLPSGSLAILLVMLRV